LGFQLLYTDDAWLIVPADNPENSLLLFK